MALNINTFQAESVTVRILTTEFFKRIFLHCKTVMGRFARMEVQEDSTSCCLLFSLITFYPSSSFIANSFSNLLAAAIITIIINNN
jgi:hypothetical protein